MIAKSTDREPRDYLHCQTCDETFDYWKYDSLADTGHDGHALRSLTQAEFEAAARHCAETGCDLD